MPSFQEICQHYEADAVTPEGGDICLIHTGPDLKAVALHEALHKRITADPAEIWVATQPRVAAWGALFDDLARRQAKIPLYVKRTGASTYTATGDYKVIHTTTDPAELQLRVTVFGASEPLSRIIFLARAD